MEQRFEFLEIRERNSLLLAFPLCDCLARAEGKTVTPASLDLILFTTNCARFSDLAGLIMTILSLESAIFYARSMD